jgi:hypothetical protein
MSRFSRGLCLFAVPVLLAACSAGGTDTPLSPTAPRHDDGGVPLMGGNATPTDSTQTTTSTTSTSSDPGLSDPTAADGGVPLMGGN